MNSSNYLNQSLPNPDILSRANFELVVRRIADDIAFGTDDSLFVGSGLEYAQSRPYEPGDPVRQIDWKLSARMPVAYIKQHETLKRVAIYLIVDTSGSMSVSSTSLSKHALAVWAAAAIGLVAVRRLSPVCVLSAGARHGRSQQDRSPSLSPDKLWRDLEPLRAHDIHESTELGERLNALSAQLSRRSLLFVFSDLHDPDAIFALRQLGHQHDVVVLHLEDPAERGGLDGGYFRGGEAESGQGFLGDGRQRWRQDCTIERDLAGADVSYLKLLTNRPMISPLRQFLSTRATRMRGQR
ncbi:hypothetical protein Q31b_08880 [Novipirellula aureliae]|uniref:DUF58 domain-containing protein n=1 Tax=Novipirellula aureliae TaxID=2527966 RepID=A0A5C6E9Q0_9BACT|nr:DUF58 domain-containing protein [Novipirellula aureliae]TWU45712.1 hypothetical protein Q31b_08880 [Novipirellula aureliae]